MTDIERWVAFSDDPKGGNPAGVVLDATALDDAEMLRIAADVGYSETAFVTADLGHGKKRVRYFSPLAEVPFCGHATVATAVALGPGEHVFVTNAGEVPVSVSDGVATLTSVATSVAPLEAGDVEALLAALGWSIDELDTLLPPKLAYAGAYHPVVAAATRRRLAELDYDVPTLKALMESRGWTTVQLIHQAAPGSFDVRNPFPVGGVYEDPATGAAAAALGGYLRDRGLAHDGDTIALRQGDDMGRPSRLTVELHAGEPGVRVRGTAVPMTA
ncbi:PhzF family phenazine biosynthesis protein [Paractinoplanes atraurantiacus]|uniref:Phenazine biosynthesis protein PhzF family n=1 Tax=Paractinoplanes atraurantiacus TaxID=1036182 RepID=A0A285IC42_9ACTN|nr:PhzF family phenazine biosynthesis isomerase [Actinoplanes atraurantiacus]SNY44511.1 phenazine biosynthesis protein PhzF family [Actinoplanes atraurantiacus]